MSDPLAKAERSRAKDARQMPAPDEEPRRKPAKKKKPIKVEYRWHEWPETHWLGGWKTFGRYQDEETAGKVIADAERKYPFFSFRVSPK